MSEKTASNNHHHHGGDNTPDKEEAAPGYMIDGGISLDRDSQLERGLKSRHIQFLALGGACVAPKLLTSKSCV